MPRGERIFYAGEKVKISFLNDMLATVVLIPNEDTRGMYGIRTRPIESGGHGLSGVYEGIRDGWWANPADMKLAFPSENRLDLNDYNNGSSNDEEFEDDYYETENDEYPEPEMGEDGLCHCEACMRSRGEID